jgi:hypothetical protein
MTNDSVLLKSNVEGYRFAECHFLQTFNAHIYIYIARTRTSYKTVPLTNLNKYLHYDTSATEVHISANNGSEYKCK